MKQLAASDFERGLKGSIRKLAKYNMRDICNAFDDLFDSWT